MQTCANLSQELEEYSSKGSLKMRLAFSRDQAQKVYVTHLLEEDADLIWDVIGEKKGHLYICGSVELQIAFIGSLTHFLFVTVTPR
jgi:sulfite reductase alpha subunit-like flavoprotein